MSLNGLGNKILHLHLSTACHLIHFGGRVLSSDLRKVRDVGDGWAGWAIANRGFGRLVNSISTKECRLCITSCPPSFR